MARKLDKDLRRLTSLEDAVRSRGQHLARLSAGLLFLAIAGLVADAFVGTDSHWSIIVIAAMVSAYMALNVGANDVANNMSPAVGSRTLTIATAVMIAAVAEAAGAIIAGGDVVATVSKGIIKPSLMPDAAAFTAAMIAALFAAAAWINLATWIGAPVSTTHSVVGGVLGAGIMMAGFGAADWGVVLQIVASWVVSPVMGGVIAAAFLAYIKFSVLGAPDKIAAARLRVPYLVGIMAGTFTVYILMKGLSRIMPVSIWLALGVGLAVAVLCVLAVRPRVARRLDGDGLHNTKVGELFTIPVICGAALLSFAHGSNDVANAIGPLAAIHQAVGGGALGDKSPLPLWVLVIGAAGISVGLLLYGPRLIRTVGTEITKLNRVRAFCITLSAAITVIIASTMGLPVSSTHIAIGALFGVGFLREYLANKSGSVPKLPEPETPPRPQGLRPPKDPRIAAEKLRRRYLVRRSHMITIVAAWIITVPVTGIIAAALAWVIDASNLINLE